MSSFHKIAFKSQWKFEQNQLLHDPTEDWVRAFRNFHRPTGLSERQVVRFCFKPAEGALFCLNDISQPLTIIKGLATATITGMMESVNRVEIIWRAKQFEALPFPEQFIAWLEISDDSRVDA